MNNATVTIEKQGRRYYLVGNTYPVKDALRSAGAHWDRDRGAWWTSKSDVAQRFAAQATAKAEARSAAAAEGNKVAIGGNTYPVRDQLRDLGGHWDAASKAWMVPASNAEAARALVASAPKRSFARRGFGGRGGGCCRECRGPIVNAPHHRAMGGLCGSCAFDEYDC